VNVKSLTNIPGTRISPSDLSRS